MNSLNNFNLPFAEKKKAPWLKMLLLVILIALAFFVGVILAQKSEIVRQFTLKKADYTGQILNKYGLIPKDKLSKDVDFNLFWNVWDSLRKQYVDKGNLNEKEMFYGAVAGMVAALGDPYTVFMDPKIAAEFEDDLAGTF